MAEYIEREKALEDFDKWIDETGAIPKGTSYYYECRACIEDVPSADVVEVVHGCWKGIELKDTCSVCNRSISEICDADSYIEIEVLSELIACPFCGAKMNGERRSENES